jgi:hypothetical protein
MSQKATNFIPIPSQKMNEILKFLAKDDMLQYIVHVFTWHPFSPFPQ